jgi:DNA mismatch repair protein MutS2
VAPPEEPFAFLGLRHPLLALQTPDKVVPSDVALRSPARALVISGPNAGGKTVALSAIGLCTAMVRAGLPIPADGHSRVPLVRSLFAAVGDAQDLARGLSTFGAHLAALRHILAEAVPGSLVLIDEIAADTDPREGAALAAAVLESLVERRTLVVATTHLDPLKALALGDPRFSNAAVGFDAQHHRPTYKLTVGQPGSSSALDLARRAGLPEEIVARAQSLLISEGGPLGKALAALEVERQRFAGLGAQLEAERAALAETERALADRARSLAIREAELAKGARQELLGELEKARAETAEILTRLRGDATIKAAGSAQRALAALQSAQQTALERVAEPIAGVGGQSGVAPGQRVRSQALGLEGELLAVEGDEGVVALGALKTRRPLADLSPASAARRKARPSANQARDRTSLVAAPLIVESDSVDLRGLRAEEALREAQRFLDQAYGNGRPQVRLVHGQGTGALKTSLREFLSSSRYVRAFRAGDVGEGGDGATVVELAT